MLARIKSWALYALAGVVFVLAVMVNLLRAKNARLDAEPFAGNRRRSQGESRARQSGGGQVPRGARGSGAGNQGGQA